MHAVTGVAKSPSLLALALVSGVSPYATDTYIAGPFGGARRPEHGRECRN